MPVFKHWRSGGFSLGTGIGHNVFQHWTDDGYTCTPLEQCFEICAVKSERQLVWIVGHHHVFEVSSVFNVTMGRISGPEIRLFKRFQKL